jgi:glycosyltransferase involved in cell wall biosynthesis
MVSIIIPVKNGVEFLKESVQSVLEQTYQDWEIIIGVNGYPLNSDVFKKAKDYHVSSPLTDKIRVFDLGILTDDENVNGKSVALNKLLEYARYDYIALLDVDDIWLPNKLELQMPYIYKYDVIGSQCIYFGDSSITPLIPLGDITYYNFVLSNPVINSSAIIRKSICYWNTRMSVEDYELWLRLKRNQNTFYNCSEILVKHRIHNKSAFNNSPAQKTDLENLISIYRGMK